MSYKNMRNKIKIILTSLEEDSRFCVHFCWQSERLRLINLGGIQNKKCFISWESIDVTHFSCKLLKISVTCK